MNRIKLSLVALMLMAMPFCVKATDTPFTVDDCAAFDVHALATAGGVTAGEWKLVAGNRLEVLDDQAESWSDLAALKNIGLEEKKAEYVKNGWRNLADHITEENKAKFKITTVRAACFRTDGGDDADEEDELTKGYVMIAVTGPAKYGTHYMYVAFSK